MKKHICAISACLAVLYVLSNCIPANALVSVSGVRSPMMLSSGIFWRINSTVARSCVLSDMARRTCALLSSTALGANASANDARKDSQVPAAGAYTLVAQDASGKFYYLKLVQGSAVSAQTPAAYPTVTPVAVPTMTPTPVPTVAPTPTPAPTATPNPTPTLAPSATPSMTPTPVPTPEPTVQVTQTPTVAPTVAASPEPTRATVTLAPYRSPAAPTVAASPEPTRAPQDLNSLFDKAA